MYAHSCNESESVVSCVWVCVSVNLLFSDVCDKCNDFVFHYLLDYSCRVFVFSLFLVDSALLSAHSQKTVDFNRNVWGVENSFALVPCFPRGFQHLAAVPFFFFLNLIPPSCSELFPSVCAPFYRIFGSGSRRLQSVSTYFAETVCFSLLLFVVSLVFCCFTFG